MNTMARGKLRGVSLREHAMRKKYRNAGADRISTSHSYWVFPSRHSVARRLRSAAAPDDYLPEQYSDSRSMRSTRKGASFVFSGT